MKRNAYGDVLLPPINFDELVENITDQFEYNDYEKEGFGDGYLWVEIYRDGTRRVWEF